MPRYTIPVHRPIGDVRARCEDPGPISTLSDIPAESFAAPPPPPPPPEVPQPTVALVDPEEVRQLFASLEEMVQEHERRRQESLGELQLLAIELAIAVASQVTQQTIDADQFGVRSLVETLVGRLGLADPITVALHPQDLELFRRQVAEQPAAWDPRQLTFVADPQLPRGSCRGTSKRGEILSEAATHLAEMRRHLLEGLDDAEIERRHPASSDPRLRRFPDRRETA